MRAAAVREVADQVRTYAAQNNAAVAAGRLLLSGGRRMVEPDVRLVTTVRGRPANVTIAAFKVEAASTSCNEIIARADAYFTEIHTLERVVVFKFFAPLRPPGARRRFVRPVFPDDDLTELSVPALAIVFERIQNTVATGGDGRRLRIAQMRSFGNADVHTTALRAFSRPPNDSPLEPFDDAYAHAGPVPATVLPRRFLVAELEAALDRARATTLAFDVAMDPPLPAIHLDLVTVFVAAMDGWYELFQAHAEGDAGGLAPTAAVAAEDGKPPAVKKEELVE